MDVRLSAEQVALRDSVAQLVDRLGPKSVADLDDAHRRVKLESAVAGAGWRDLRSASDDGTPWASAVEAAIVAEELARGLADVPYVGPVLAGELRRLSDTEPAGSHETIALTPDLGALADDVPALAFDAAGASHAVVATPRRVASYSVTDAHTSVDLTRQVATVVDDDFGGEARDVMVLGDADVRWEAFALALSCADLVGVMRGTIALATDYATVRQQYGALIGSFQAVQHLLADAFVAMEGSRSVALHAAWGVDALSPYDALAAAATAKAYCARAARLVCEASIQVHGGIGNTWDCLAHVFLRRALVSSDLLGGVGVNLDRVLAHQKVVAHGLR